MFNILQLNSSLLIILVITLGAISEKYIKIVKKGIKNNSLNYKEYNLYKLISSILVIIDVILSITIYFQMNVSL